MSLCDEKVEELYHSPWIKKSRQKVKTMYENTYNLDDWIETFTDITNRKIDQTYHLYYFLNGNTSKLAEFELKLHTNCKHSHVPITKEGIHKILKMKANPGHPFFNKLCYLSKPWFYIRNRYLFSVYNHEYHSDTVKGYSKRGIILSTFKREKESFENFKNNLINTHGNRLQYIYDKLDTSKILYNHILTNSLEYTHKKLRLNMVSINQEGFSNFKTFILTSNDNQRTYLMKVGCKDSIVLSKEAISAVLLSILKIGRDQDIKTRYDLITTDYDEYNTILDLLDKYSIENKTWLRILDFQRIESIPDNKQFVTVDYLPQGNYYAATGIFTENGKDNDLTTRQAGKLILSQIVSERPLVLREEDLLQSIKDTMFAQIAKQIYSKLKNNATEKAKEKAKIHIQNHFNFWLDSVVLTRQQIVFDYPVKNMTVGQFMEENNIKLIKAIYV